MSARLAPSALEGESSRRQRIGPAGLGPAIIGRWPAAFAGSPLRRAAAVVALANLTFFGAMAALPLDPDTAAARVRSAFASGDLGLNDYLPLDSRRGWHQYNDCNALQMLSNPDESLMRRALAPRIYKADRDFNHSCTVLFALTTGRSERSTLLSFRYARYWHGYLLPPALALTIVELRVLRVLLVISVCLALALLVLAGSRGGPHMRRTAFAIALATMTLWAVPYFAPGLTHGPGDAALLCALAVLMFRPQLATEPRTLLPYAAGFGAVVVFLEMLTGQLPTAAAWLVAVTLAAARDSRRTQTNAPLLALAALAAFGAGAAATVIVKQILAMALAEPNATGDFMSQLRQYMSVPSGHGIWPGMLVPYGRLARNASMLTFGHKVAGYGLLVVVAVLWLVAVIRVWAHRGSELGRDLAALIGASVIPLLWVLLLPRHTFIHAPFMVRMLIVPISLAPLALWWPVARQNVDVRSQAVWLGGAADGM